MCVDQDSLFNQTLARHLSLQALPLGSPVWGLFGAVLARILMSQSSRNPWHPCYLVCLVPHLWYLSDWPASLARIPLHLMSPLSNFPSNGPSWIQSPPVLSRTDPAAHLALQRVNAGGGDRVPSSQVSVPWDTLGVYWRRKSTTCKHIRAYTCACVSEFALITREPKIPFLFIFLFLLPIRPRRRCLRVQIHLTVKADLSVAQALKWEKGGNNPKVTKILLQSLLVVS